MNEEFEHDTEFFGDGDDGAEDRFGDEDGDGKMTEELAFERIAANPKSLKERIDSSLEILNNFKNREDKRISRSDVIETLRKDISEYYGYIPELAEFLLELFSPAECLEFVEASDRPRPLVIRTNTLKTNRKDLMEALVKRGAAVEAIEWSKVAIKVSESTVPIGATPEYLAGYYMLQSAASMNPVMALDPQPGERVLDMSAAPGGKTSFIAQLMKNSGIVIANDLKEQRQKATIANLHRMGIKNAIVCIHDGRKIPKVMKGFDRVLLDAPCSGLGVISRDQSVKLQRTVKDIQRIAHLQKELICAAIDSVDPKSKTGGFIVYSTCSISCEENEQVVQYALSRRFVRLVDTGLTVGKPGLTRFKDKRFHPSLALTRRFYPHVHNMDGFYVAKLQKYKNGVKNEGEDDEDEDAEEESGSSVNSDDSDNSNSDEDDDDDDDEEEEEEVKPSKNSKPAVSNKPVSNQSSAKPNTNISAGNSNKPNITSSTQQATSAVKRSVNEVYNNTSVDKSSKTPAKSDTPIIKEAPAPVTDGKKTKATPVPPAAEPSSATPDKASKLSSKPSTPVVVEEAVDAKPDSTSKKAKSAPVTPANELKPSTPKVENDNNSSKMNNDDDDDDDDIIPIDRRRSSFGRKKHMKLRDMVALSSSSPK